MSTNKLSGGGQFNTATPWYVTSSTYTANFPAPYNRQDVLNTAKDCTNLYWTGTTAGSSITFNRLSATSTTVTVHSPACCTTSTTNVPAGVLAGGDSVWVYGGTGVIGNTYNVAGATIGVSSPDDFTYSSSADGINSCSTCTYISAGQSSPVPYEQPYLIAWEAFIAAANAHFNPNYMANSVIVGSGGTTGTGQLGYIRSGTWTGGESFAPCITAPSGIESLSTLGSPYTFTTSPNTWLGDYHTKVDYVESLSPTMSWYWPIDTIVAGDTTYPNTMAQYATSVGNGHGLINGFGSQGLSQLDEQNGCTSDMLPGNWCNLFTSLTYQPYRMPLQLQQISISDPLIMSCSATTCGTPPRVSGDLRVWLPFAVNTGGSTVIEMYYQDLGLAFDTQYCPTQSGGACASGYGLPSYVTTTQQATWCNQVGLCNGSCPGGSACYGSYITKNHGPR